MNEIVKLKWKDIEKLNKEKTCLFVTAAPVEEHGLHLPVSIDIDLGKYWEESAVLKLQNRYPDYNFLSLPTIPLAFRGGERSGHRHHRGQAGRRERSTCQTLPGL